MKFCSLVQLADCSRRTRLRKQTTNEWLRFKRQSRFAAEQPLSERFLSSIMGSE